MIITTNRL